MMTHKSTSKPVCLLLSGAELADLDLSGVELYMGSSSYESTTRVELRRKSGLAAGTMANSLPWLWASASSSRSSSSSSSASGHYSSSLSNDALFDSSWASADGWNSQRCLRLLHYDETAQEHGLAPAPPIVLKSKEVLEMEKLEMAAVAGKPAAAAAAAAAGRKSNTETAAPSLAAASTAVVSHRRPPKTSQPLPLPLPPASPASSKHRRQTSIDLRSSPAAKFLVQLMPWEVPSPPPPLRGHHDSSTLSPAPHCFVPFKWEEAPGRPKPAHSFTATSTVHPRLLRLPPRLLVQQDGHRKTARESSPTSILDPESGFCSSSSSPQAVPKPSRLKALWSWSILDLVLGKKNEPKNSEQEFDPFQGCGRRRRVRVVSMKKQRGGRRARNHANHSMVDDKSTASTPGSSYVFPSPAAFTWFDSPNHHRCVQHRRWASRKIVATCRALKRMAMGERQHKSQSPATMYRPLLCRVDADSAAFACSSSSL